MTLECKCGTTLVIAGGFSRKYPNHSREQGVVPPDGRSTWGIFTCHQCTSTVMIPPTTEAVPIPQPVLTGSTE